MKKHITKNQVLQYEKEKDTYIHFLQENFVLTKQLIALGNKNFVGYNPNNLEKFFKGRAIHLQVMSLIGVNTEHLVKLILAKRGYMINKVLYTKTNSKDNNTDIVYSHILIGFKESVDLFNRCNQDKYFKDIKPYVMNSAPDIYDEYEYFGRKKISPEKCLGLLVDVRNSYLHYANAQGEQNGIIWYLYNFVLWLAKNEFKDEFKKYKYVGGKDAEKLFK